jgi:glycosyltransferase involved in cell wall biosynthesis
VLAILPTLGVGGAERFLVDLAVALQAHDVSMHLFLLRPEGELLSEARELAIPVLSAGPTHGKLRRALPRIGRRLARVATSYDVILGGLELDSTFLALFAARFAKKKSAGIVHTEIDHFLSFHPSWIRYRLVRFVYPRLDVVVTVSHATYASAMKHRARSSNTEVIHSAVDLDRVKYLAAIGDTYNVARPYVMGLGRLVPEKGFDSLIRAYTRLRAAGAECDLVIVGDGPEFARLNSLIHDLGVSNNVHLPGILANPYPTLANAAVLCQPSRYEGFGLAIVEALALGIPVVATDCPGGIAEILAHGEYGTLVPRQSERALSDALLTHLARPDEYRANAERGLKRAEVFSIDAAAREYAALLRRVVNR